MKRTLQMLTVAATALRLTLGATAAFAEEERRRRLSLSPWDTAGRSIHEEATNSTLAPYMSVFNNLVCGPT